MAVSKELKSLNKDMEKTDKEIEKYCKEVGDWNTVLENCHGYQATIIPRQGIILSQFA